MADGLILGGAAGTIRWLMSAGTTAELPLGKVRANLTLYPPANATPVTLSGLLAVFDSTTSAVVPDQTLLASNGQIATWLNAQCSFGSAYDGTLTLTTLAGAAVDLTGYYVKLLLTYEPLGSVTPLAPPFVPLGSPLMIAGQVSYLDGEGGKHNVHAIGYNVYQFPLDVADRVLLGAGITDGADDPTDNYSYVIPYSAYGNYIAIEVPLAYDSASGTYVGNSHLDPTTWPTFLFDSAAYPSPLAFDVEVSVLPILHVQISEQSGSAWSGCTFHVHDGPLVTDPVIASGVTAGILGEVYFADISFRTGDTYYVEIPSQTPPSGAPNQSGGASGVAPADYYISTAP